MPSNSPAVGVTLLQKPLVAESLSIHIIDLEASVMNKRCLAERMGAEEKALCP